MEGSRPGLHRQMLLKHAGLLSIESLARTIRRQLMLASQNRGSKACAESPGSQGSLCITSTSGNNVCVNPPDRQPRQAIASNTVHSLSWDPNMHCQYCYVARGIQLQASTRLSYQGQACPEYTCGGWWGRPPAPDSPLRQNWGIFSALIVGVLEIGGEWIPRRYLYACRHGLLRSPSQQVDISMGKAISSKVEFPMVSM